MHLHNDRPRTLLIAHEDDRLNREGMAAWLASFSTLAGVVSITETAERRKRRVRRELRRVGFWRFVDVLAFQLYYRAFVAHADRAWTEHELRRIKSLYGSVPDTTPVLHVSTPNSDEVEQFIRRAAPDLVIARCKTLLQDRIFTLPRSGTLVMHPGICPEYRNAHGCFWALAREDYGRVGMTLLRIDRGVDTGPVFGYYSYPFDERHESHIVIQHRVVFENLEPLRSKLMEIARGTARPLDTSGRDSRAWGQPWLSQYLKWKRRVKRTQRNGARHQPALP